MKIVVFEIGQDWEIDAFGELEKEHELVFTKKELTEKNAEEYKDAEIITTFIYSKLGEDILKKMPGLKMIATRSTGYDHIDKEYCEKKGIIAANVPSYGNHTVAEYTFSLILNISRNLCKAVERTDRGDFSVRDLEGFDLFEKTIGVIGTGDIGMNVIRIAKGFGMNVLGYDIYPKEELAEEIGFKYVDKNELIRNSDIITLHIPETKENRDFIAKEEFDIMKDAVVLINTSRGAIVSVKDLLRAIEKGKVAAAGVDVLPEEDYTREDNEMINSIFDKKANQEALLANHILLRLNNVFITPHVAYNTKEATQRIIKSTLENIHSFAKGDPANVVIGGE
ncbi:MAG: NAD(P)-dependent oxidoreductase [Bacteroidota bacterium]